MIIIFKLLIWGMAGAIIMPSYEFLLGYFYYYRRGLPVAWEYIDQTGLRRISAFTWNYFLAWFILGVIHGIALEFVSKILCH